MGDIMKQVTERDIVYSICEYGLADVWEWGAEVGGNLWRTTGDIWDDWDRMKMIGFEQTQTTPYAKPGHWNDPDMLVIGLNGKGASASANGASGCTVTEYEAQFGLWSLLSAPLLMTCDIRNMDADTKRILTNKELIAVNQDKLGKQARRIYKESCKEFWAKPLADGSYAVGFLNRHDDETLDMTLDLNRLGIKGEVTARDLWKYENIGSYKNEITLKVKPHECKVIKITPKQ
jgi:alpha-galactosidase